MFPARTLIRRGDDLVRRRHNGFTLIEIAIVLTLIGVLATIALPIYQNYRNRVKVTQAVLDIGLMSVVINAYREDAQAYPSSLAAVGMDTRLDPWGNPYRYLPLDVAGNIGFARKDRALVPINTDFDLYSMGADGQTVAPIAAPVSLDDVVRANNGRYVGLASKY